LAPGVVTDVAVPTPLAWGRVVRSEANCRCVSLRSGDTVEGPRMVRIDLASEPDAKSFAPNLALFDADHRLVGRIEIDIAIVRPATAAAAALPTSACREPALP
jgi:hypothetical protein